MSAREAPRSSRSFGPMLPPAGRTGRGTVHESPAMVTDESSIGPAIVHNSNSSLPSHATAANPTLPSNATSRLKKAAMQSSWIQRLKPFGQAIDSEEEPTKPWKERHVWTHFTKDFSSCNRRLNKASHHMRSSSWSPDEPPCKDLGLPHRKLAEPADSKEQHHRLRKISPIFRDRNLRVPSEDTTHSDASSNTGNLFSSQQNGFKRGSAQEALVPCSQNRGASSEEPREDGDGDGDGDGCKAKDFAAQHFQHLVKNGKKVSSVTGVGVSWLTKPSLLPEIISESPALLKGAFSRVLGDTHAKGGLFFSESAYRGASADANGKTFSLPTLLRDANPDFSESHGAKMQNKKEPSRASLVNLNCETSIPAAVSGSTVKKDRFGQTGLFNREVSGNDLDMGSKAGGDFGFLHFGVNPKGDRQSAAKPYVSHGPCYGGASDRFCISSRNIADASNRMQGKKGTAAFAVGSSTVATIARPSTLEQSNAPSAFNAFCRRGKNLVSSDNPLHLKEALANKMPFMSASSDGDVARSGIRETSLDEYWNSRVQLFEEPTPVKPEETGSSTASLSQEYILEEYSKYCLKSTANTMKSDATNRLEDFSSPSPHRLVNADDENHSLCDLPRQTHKMFSDYEKSPIQIKQTGWGQERCALAASDRTSPDGLKILKKSQEQNLHLYKGARGTVALQVNNEDPNLHPRLSYNSSINSGMQFTHQSHKVLNDERTGEASSAHQAWIQRWRGSCYVRTERKPRF